MHNILWIAFVTNAIHKIICSYKQDFEISYSCWFIDLCEKIAVVPWINNFLLIFCLFSPTVLPSETAKSSDGPKKVMLAPYKSNGLVAGNLLPTFLISENKTNIYFFFVWFKVHYFYNFFFLLVINCFKYKNELGVI